MIWPAFFFLAPPPESEIVRGLVGCQGSTEVDRRGGFGLDSPSVPARTWHLSGKGQHVGKDSAA